MPGTGYAKEPEGDAPQGTTETLGEKAANVARGIRDKTADLGQGTADAIDQKRGPAADTMASAAATLHEKADNLPGVETASRLAHQTADKLQASADYVRGHDTKAMMNDVENFVKDHPAQSLAVAAAVGFLVGHAFRRD